MDGAFFPVSKILWSLARPEVWMLVLILAGFLCLAFNRRKAALAAIGLAGAFYLAVGFFPLAQPLLRPLESYAPVDPAMDAPSLIVVLGGAEEADRTALTGLPSVNAAAERFLAAIALARRYPNAQIVFTGGNGWFRDGAPSGAIVAERIFQQAGIDASRVVLEGQSLNTWQNAVLTLPLVEDRMREGPVVLVTSAFHMRRSLATFCAAGWRGLVGYPTDFRGVGAPAPSWRFTDNLKDLDIAVKEWVGLTAYARSGRAVDPETVEGCLQQ